MFTHLLTRGWSLPGGVNLITKRVEVQAGAEHNLDEEIPASTNNLVAFTLDVSQAKALFIQADGDLTIKTNSSGSPVNTIELKAGVPFQWMSNADGLSGDAPLRDTAGTAISTDITALYVTNGGTDPVTLQLRCLADPTV